MTDKIHETLLYLSMEKKKTETKQKTFKKHSEGANFFKQIAYFNLTYTMFLFG